MADELTESGFVAFDESGQVIPMREALRRAASQLSDEEKREEVPYLLESLSAMQHEGATEEAHELLSFYRELGFPLPDELPPVESTPERLENGEAGFRLAPLLELFKEREVYFGLPDGVLRKVILYHMSGQTSAQA